MGDRTVGRDVAVMSDEETQQLIVVAKGEAEACDQLVFWSQRLRQALDARRRLLEISPARLKSALEGK